MRTVPMARWYWNAACLIMLLAADGWLNALSVVVIWLVPYFIARMDGPHRSEGRRATVGADGTSEPQDAHHTDGSGGES